MSSLTKLEEATVAVAKVLLDGGYNVYDEVALAERAITIAKAILAKCEDEVKRTQEQEDPYVQSF